MKKIADGFKDEKAIIIPYTVRKMQMLNPITKQLFLTHIGYYPNARFHYRNRPQGCDENIFIFCQKGTGVITHKNQTFTLSQNQVFIIPANETHTYNADDKDPWSVYWFHFLGKNTSLFRSIIGKIIDVENSDEGRCEDRFLIFEEMYQNLEMGYNPENLEYVSNCLMYFLTSLKYTSQYRKAIGVKENDVVQKSILFMKENLENKITLEDIAKHVGYSNSHFGTLFTERTSYSPMEYYNQLKIQRACSLLQFSDLKIKEIAFRLGYYDPFHFSKAFHNEMKISPKEYRKDYQRQME